MLERVDEVRVRRRRLVVALLAALLLLLEQIPPGERGGELGVRVGVLDAADEELEALDQVGVPAVLLAQRRRLLRMVDDERRLHELLLGVDLEELGDAEA